MPWEKYATELGLYEELGIKHRWCRVERCPGDGRIYVVGSGNGMTEQHRYQCTCVYSPTRRTYDASKATTSSADMPTSAKRAKMLSTVSE